MLTWISHFGSLSFWLQHLKKVEIKKLLQSKHFLFWMNEWFHFQRDVQLYREAQSQNMQHSPKQLIKAYITPLNKIPIYTSIKMEKLSPFNNLFLSYYLVFMKSVLLLPILSNIVVHDLWDLCSSFIKFYNLSYLL